MRGGGFAYNGIEAWTSSGTNGRTLSSPTSACRDWTVCPLIESCKEFLPEAIMW
ncbi:MAG: hypothetical protein ACLTC4_19890 [Hungatella hathewayi]